MTEAGADARASVATEEFLKSLTGGDNTRVELQKLLRREIWNAYCFGKREALWPNPDRDGPNAFVCGPPPTWDPMKAAIR